MKILRKSWAVIAQRTAVGGVGQPGAGQRLVEQGADHGPGERVVLGPDPPLEQQRRGRQPEELVLVAGAHQGHCPVAAADPADDGAEHVRELRGDEDETLHIGLRWRDLQQRDDLAGAGQPVLDQAVMAEL